MAETAKKAGIRKKKGGPLTRTQKLTKFGLWLIVAYLALAIAQLLVSYL